MANGTDARLEQDMIAERSKPTPQSELEHLEAMYSTIISAMFPGEGREKATPAEILAFIQEEDARFIDPDGDAFAAMRNINERIRQIESAPDLLGGVALSALSSAGFSGVDEALGFIFGEETKEEFRRQQAAFRRERPGAAFASELAGGLLVPGIGGAALAGRGAQAGTRLARVAGVGSQGLTAGGRRALGLAAGAGTGATIGAVEGGVVGALEAEGGFGERARGAAVGAGLGFGLGGVLGGAVAGVPQAFRFLTGRTGRSPEEGARAFAQEAAGARGPEGVLDEFTRIQELVPEARLVDVPEMRAVGEQAAIHSAQARVNFQADLPPRAKGATQRVIDDITENLDGPTPSARARAESVQTKIQQGSEAFEALTRTVTSVQDEAIDGLLTSQAVREVMPAVNRRLRRAGIDAPKLTKKGAEGVIERTDDLPSFRQLQSIKLQLDDEVSALYRGGRPSEAGELAGLRDEFRDAMEEAVAGFGDAQSRWMMVMREKDALQAGMQFGARNVSAEQVADDLARFNNISPEAGAAYLEGASSAIIDQMRRTARRGDVTRFFDNIEMQDKMAQLFPTEEIAQRFFQQVDVEQGFALTMQQVLGGSPTAVRQTQSLVDFLTAPTGRRTTQRIAESPFAPGIALSRLGGELQQRAAGERGRRAAASAGDVLSQSLLGRTGGLSARNLLTGSTGLLGTPLGLATRSPRALLQALQGPEQREREF